MARCNLPSFLVALSAACQLVTATASAHIALEDPMPRYPNPRARENKACPCGVGDSNRVCTLASDRSDENRTTDRVTTLTAGSTIIVRFDEYVGHAGRHRIAFDNDGADLDDFNANILVDIPDPRGNVGNVDDGSIWEIPVRVPNTPCTNCTLQIIQMMDGNMEDPVPDPVGRSSYYQCADIVIVPGDGTATDPGGSAGAVGTGATGVGGRPDAGSADPDTTDAELDDASAGADAGCNIVPGRNAAGWSAFGALSLLILSRRRGRRGSAAHSS